MLIPDEVLLYHNMPEYAPNTKYCNNTIYSFEEKETDVRMAISMLTDVYQKKMRCNYDYFC